MSWSARSIFAVGDGRRLPSVAPPSLLASPSRAVLIPTPARCSTLRLAIASLLFLALIPSTAQAAERPCTRQAFHQTARPVYKSLSPVTRAERHRVRHAVLCLARPASRRIVRAHLKRYKAGHHRRRVASLSPQAFARYLLRRRPGQYGCLAALIGRESGWRVNATNPSSGAYGIPQALPGGKMASHGSDWRWNPRTQLRWMVDYCDGRYNGPCGALAHSHANGWY